MTAPSRRSLFGWLAALFVAPKITQAGDGIAMTSMAHPVGVPLAETANISLSACEDLTEEAVERLAASLRASFAAPNYARIALRPTFAIYHPDDPEVAE